MHTTPAATMHVHVHWPIMPNSNFPLVSYLPAVHCSCTDATLQHTLCSLACYQAMEAPGCLALLAFARLQSQPSCHLSFGIILLHNGLGKCRRVPSSTCSTHVPGKSPNNSTVLMVSHPHRACPLTPAHINSRTSSAIKQYDKPYTTCHGEV